MLHGASTLKYKYEITEMVDFAKSLPCFSHVDPDSIVDVLANRGGKEQYYTIADGKKWNFKPDRYGATQMVDVYEDTFYEPSLFAISYYCGFTCFCCKEVFKFTGERKYLLPLDDEIYNILNGASNKIDDFNFSSIENFCDDCKVQIVRRQNSMCVSVVNAMLINSFYDFKNLIKQKAKESK